MRGINLRTIIIFADISGPNALRAIHVTAQGKLNINVTAETVTLIARSSEEDEPDEDEDFEETDLLEKFACSF